MTAHGPIKHAPCRYVKRQKSLRSLLFKQRARHWLRSFERRSDRDRDPLYSAAVTVLTWTLLPAP
jgi:hypothetical protein